MKKVAIILLTMICLLSVIGLAVNARAETFTEYHVEKIKAFRISTRSTDIVGTLNGLFYDRPLIKIPMRAEITAYCACKRCNGKYSIDGHSTKTATPLILRNEPEYADKYCAATKAVGDFGDIVIIDGISYEIVDRMGRKDGKAIDIFVPNHQQGNDEYERRRNYAVEVIKR